MSEMNRKEPQPLNKANPRPPAPPSPPPPPKDRSFTLIVNEGGAVRERVVSIKRKEYDPHGCKHNTALVDEKLWQIECRDCGKILDPIQFLVDITRKEEHAEFHYDRIKREYRRIEKAIEIKTHTECEHCGKTTRIAGARG